MTRISFTDEDGALRWFDDAATQVDVGEGRNWNGNNWIGAVSGLQTNRAWLYLTSGGRWIENVNATSEFSGSNSWRYLTDDQAREWLMKSADARRDDEDAAEALAKYFPDTPEESGPSKGGRPTVGPAISMAYPRELLDRIEAAAKEAGVSRAEFLRNLADKHV